MPNRTIYVKEADAELWEKAEKLAGGSVSSLLSGCLGRKGSLTKPSSSGNGL